MSIYDEDGILSDEDIIIDGDDDPSEHDDAALFLLGVDEETIAKSLDRVQVPTLREALDRSKRLQVLLGDSQPMVANFCADIESAVRCFLLELNRDPASILMASLAGMEPDVATHKIDQLIGLLAQHKSLLNDLGGR